MRTVFDVPAASDELEDEDFYSSLDDSKVASQIVSRSRPCGRFGLCPESVTPCRRIIEVAEVVDLPIITMTNLIPLY